MKKWRKNKKIQKKNETKRKTTTKYRRDANLISIYGPHRKDNSLLNDPTILFSPHISSVWSSLALNSQAPFWLLGIEHFIRSPGLPWTWSIKLISSIAGLIRDRMMTISVWNDPSFLLTDDRPRLVTWQRCLCVKTCGCSNERSRSLERRSGVSGCNWGAKIALERPYTPTDDETKDPDGEFQANCLNSVVFLQSLDATCQSIV